MTELLRCPPAAVTLVVALATCSSALASQPARALVESQYRSAGTVLVLVDTHANLVVDVLPALPAGSR